MTSNNLLLLSAIPLLTLTLARAAAGNSNYQNSMGRAVRQSTYKRVCSAAAGCLLVPGGTVQHGWLKAPEALELSSATRPKTLLFLT